MDSRAPVRLALLFLLFWGIGLSLGYPTLNRYDPGQTGVADARYYAELVEAGVIEPKDVGHWRYRILVPALARPIYLAVRGHVGSWEPRYLSLLLINAMMCAGAATAIFLLARDVMAADGGALIAPLLFFANFNTSNLYLSGLIDSVEVASLALATLLMVRRRWWWLVPLAVLGALGKETTPLFLGAAAAGWLGWDAWTKRRIDWRAAVPAAAAAAAGLTTVIVLRQILGTTTAIPLGVSGQSISWSPVNILMGIPQYFAKPAFYYTFLWVLPLTALGWHRLAPPLRACLVATFLLGLLLSSFANVGDNIGRPLFNAGAAVFCVAAAVGLERLTRYGR